MSGASDGSTWESDNTVTNGFGLKNTDWTTYSNGSRINTDSPYTPISSIGLDSILTNVGANLWPDSIDTRNIGYFSSGGGNVISSPSDVGGFPTITSGTLYPDSDGDGMSDAWEMANGTNPSVADNNGFDVDADYTNLQMFLSYMAQDETTPDPEPEPETSITPTVFRMGTTISPFFYIGTTKYNL
jgi:hypothetical protein